MVRDPNRTGRVGSECGSDFDLGFETLESNRSGLVWFGFCRFELSQLVSQKKLIINQSINKHARDY